MDAEATGFPDAASTSRWRCSWPRWCRIRAALMAEMRRVVRPGGHILFVNHFAAERGPRWWVERAMAPASRALGWHPDFAMDALLNAAEQPRGARSPVPPFGLFTLVRLHQPGRAESRAC